MNEKEKRDNTAFFVFLGLVYLVIGLAAAIVVLFIGNIMAPEVGAGKSVEIITYYDNLECIAWAVGLVSPAIIFFLFRLRMKRGEKTFLLQDYYLACVDAGITSLSTAVERERALLVAKNSSKFNSLVDIYEESFNKGKIQHETTMKTQQNNQLSAEVEKAKQDAVSARLQLEKYAEYIGRDKRVRMLDDEKHANIEAAKSYRKGGNDAFSIGQQKELSWGLTGGIASGIAGPAAGLAAASHTQAKNVQIRQQNEQNKALVMPLVAKAFDKAFECDKKVETLQKSIEATKLKLVGDVAQEELLEHLQFADIESAFTASKALAFTVKVSLVSKVLIFDTVPALIDGTIKANFSQNGKDIGSALMSFPTYGIGPTIRSVTLKGICLSEEFDTSAPITVKYEPYHLWAMEK